MTTTDISRPASGPKLAHPTDDDPFAGIPNADDSANTIPLAEALAPYAARTDARRKARRTVAELVTETTPKLNHQQASYGVSVLFGLGAPGREKHVYGGTVPAGTVRRRRAKNRAARVSRRINRKAGAR